MINTTFNQQLIYRNHIRFQANKKREESVKSTDNTITAENPVKKSDYINRLFGYMNPLAAAFCVLAGFGYGAAAVLPDKESNKPAIPIEEVDTSRMSEESQELGEFSKQVEEILIEAGFEKHGVKDLADNLTILAVIIGALGIVKLGKETKEPNHTLSGYGHLPFTYVYSEMNNTMGLGGLYAAFAGCLVGMSRNIENAQRIKEGKEPIEYDPSKFQGAFNKIWEKSKHVWGNSVRVLELTQEIDKKLAKNIIKSAKNLRITLSNDNKEELQKLEKLNIFTTKPSAELQAISSVLLGLGGVIMFMSMGDNELMAKTGSTLSGVGLLGNNIGVMTLGKEMNNPKGLIIMVASACKTLGEGILAYNPYSLLGLSLKMAGTSGFYLNTDEMAKEGQAKQQEEQEASQEKDYETSIK